MSAMEPLYQALGIKSFTLTKAENLFIEANLFTCLCDELKNIFKEQYKNYFRLMKFNTNEENRMLETQLARLVIKDILSTEEYTVEGIARYADIPEEVVEEVFSSINTSPSAIFLRRLIELHRSIRPDLYYNLMKKIISEYC